MKYFQLKHSQCDSVIFPETFSLGSSKNLLNLSLVDNSILLTDPGIYLKFIIELRILQYLFVTTKCS